MMDVRMSLVALMGGCILTWVSARSTLANGGAQAFKLLFQQTVADHFSREAEIAKEVALANAPPLRT
jgi:hypothetical protein